MAIGAQALEQLLGTETSVREFHMYQSLAKFTPSDIAGWLHTKGGMVGQDAAVQAVASALYSHWHFPLRPKQNLLLIGDTGCGKSELMRAVQRFFAKNIGADLGHSFVRVCDGSQLNASGWRGGVKLADVLRGIKMPFGAVLFIDEFDKCVSERYAGGDHGSWSVSEMIQSQLLTTLDHQVVQLSGEDGQSFTVDCQKLTIIAMGAFASLREKKRLQNERRSIGFSSAASSAATSATDITSDDLSECMMPETAGRLQPVLMDPVSSDMMLRIAEQQVKTLCDTMELHIIVPEAKLRIMAEDAFSSGQGGRAIMKQLQTALDKCIYDDPYRDMYIL